MSVNRIGINEKCPLCENLYPGSLFIFDGEAWICKNCFRDGRLKSEKLNDDIIHSLKSDLATVKAENEKLREALQNIIDMGHNDDCLMCGRKDYHAKQKLEGK